MQETSNAIRLTQYSHGAGCGCKIAPKVLSSILAQGSTVLPDFPQLIVGNTDRDDAAVVDLGDGTALISTTDFFMPIVDDAFDFGRIASVNAISDVYAMGGTPILAIAILGWPVNTLPPEVAAQVMHGARQACADANIPLAGGHSIDSPEPIFGLAVSGRVDIAHLKTNNNAQVGDLLFLTKPLGVGMLTTAQKKEILQPEHTTLARDSMIILNAIGKVFATLPYVHAMTDVTGFGLFGHLLEMCQASKVTAELWTDTIPVLNKAAITHYYNNNCVPGGTHRNWESYGQHIHVTDDFYRTLCCDPQTSGGLLVSVDAMHKQEFVRLAMKHGLTLQAIGTVTRSEDENLVVVKS